MAEERRTTDPSRVEDGPSISSEHWQGASVTVAIVAFIFVVITAVYIVSAERPQDEAFRAQAMAPILLAVGALVTFCTVIWRGLITDAQAKEQRRQNDANERSSFASDLDKGAKNLGEAEKESYQLAGVALLEAVIADPQKRYSVQAMNVLASFFLATFRKNPKSHAVESARQALNAGLMERGIRSTVSGELEFVADGPEQLKTDEFRWDHLTLVPAVTGFTHLRIRGGKITPQSARILFSQVTASDGAIVRQNVQCRDVRIEGIEIPTNISFDNCEFVACRMPDGKDMTADILVNNTFNACDFSGAKFIAMGLPNLFTDYTRGIDPTVAYNREQHRSWYYEDKPPVALFLLTPNEGSDVRFIELPVPLKNYLQPRERKSPWEPFTQGQPQARP